MTQHHPTPIKNQNGFTLIEVIAVMVIIGITAAVIASKASNFTSTNDLAAKAYNLKLHLRYTQMTAMNSDSDSLCKISFTGSPLKIYQLERYDGSWSDLNIPGEQTNELDMGNIYIALDTPVIFNNRGIPMNPSDTTLFNTSDTTITLTDGSNSIQLQVTKNTGYTKIL